MNSFDSGSIPLSNGAAWTLLQTVIAQGRGVTVGVTIGNNDVSDFKVTAAAMEGGDHVDLAVGSAGDFAATNVVFPQIVGYSLAAGTTFVLEIDGRYPEYKIWAKDASSSARVRGSVVPRC